MGSALSAIESIGSDIASGLESAVEDIAGTIENAGEGIYHLLDGIITGNFSQVISSLSGLAKYIFTAATVLEPELTPFLSGLNLSLPSFLSILPPDIISAGADTISFVKEAATYANKIYAGPISSALTGFNDLSDVAQVVYYSENGNYIAAIDTAFSKVAPEINAHVNGALTNILNWINGVRSDIRTINDDLYVDISRFGAGLGSVQDDLNVIGDAFGVKEFNNFADAIGNFRNNILGSVEQDIGVVQGHISNLFDIVVNPLSEIVMTYENVMSNNMEAAQKRSILSSSFFSTIFEENMAPDFRVVFKFPTKAEMLGGM